MRMGAVHLCSVVLGHSGGEGCSHAGAVPDEGGGRRIRRHPHQHSGRDGAALPSW